MNYKKILMFLNGQASLIPRPRRHLLLALMCTSLFAVLAILVASGSPIVRLDWWMSDGCYRYTIDHPRIHNFFHAVTDLGWGQLVKLIATLSIVVLIFRREWFRALVWTAGQLAGYEIVPLLKEQFERPRPQFADIDGFSFPSGHAFSSATVYGLLGLVILRVWASSRWRWLWAGLVWALIPMVALSRIMLGVHYFSDVLAGMSLGLAWAFWCAAVSDWWDVRRARAPLRRASASRLQGSE
jgi:undecaprenyl-diphosphatase